MTKQDSDSGEQTSSSTETLWEFVPLADYSLPPTPTVSAAQDRWGSLKRLFGGRKAKAPAKAEDDLRGLPRERLDALVRPLDWYAGAEALQRAFEQSADQFPVRVLVGPPHGGHADLLASWASRQGARQIEDPSFEDILSGGNAWLTRWRSGASPWVLPRLENCWLRHPAGLGLARALMEQALIGDLGRGVIGCDSWAWSYLGHVAPLQVAGVLTLQAFDSGRLAELFRTLTSVGPERSLHFCNARTGKRILSVPGEDDGDGGLDLQNLAAHARGNPGIARALWRERLRSEPESGEESADQDAPEEGKRAEEIVWVSALRDEPELPDGLPDDIALVLHALLLHGGLPTPMLGKLLPLPGFRLQAILPQLCASDIIERDRTDFWRVTASGYAPARAFLHERGFLVDAL
jgi:hypothetical protein